MVLQIILFRGESTCKTAKRCQLCQSQLHNPNIGVMELFISSDRCTITGTIVLHVMSVSS